MAEGTPQYGRHEHFAPVAQQLWEELLTQIKHDVTKMNAEINPGNTADRPAMNGEIEINGRSLIPGPHELHLDKLAFPSREDGYSEDPMSLTVQLDIVGETIRIISKDNPETQGWNTIGVIELHLADDNHIYSESYNGEKYLMMEMTPEKLSESILRAFLPHRRRTCGTS